MTLIRAVIACLAAISLSVPVTAQRRTPPVAADPMLAARDRWVDSVYSRLSDEERIGQLFMVAAYSGGPNFNAPAVTKLIENHQIGGVIFMQGGPVRQALLTNKYQAMAQVPLLVAMDAEWGLGMRLDSVANLPKQMMIGASRDTALAYQVGMAIAYQCRRLGVHIDFAPVIDVNNNPGNPVINSRSFGENKQWVTQLGIAYMRGLQESGVMACAKHFPGHGDTDVDSHQDLPVIRKTLEQLDTLELYPFREMFKAGVQSVMVAHLSIPSLETEAHVPTTLSKNTVTTLLKERMGYQGLVFTDALNMEGVAKYFAPGEADLRAFVAGNDVLLFAQNVPTAIQKIKNAMRDGSVTEQRLSQSVKKILAAKFTYGLNNFRPINTENLTEDLNEYVEPIRRVITEAAVTSVGNGQALQKIRQSNSKVLYVGVNATTGVLYDKLKESIGNLQSRWLPRGSTASTVTNLVKATEGYDAVVVGIHGSSLYPGGNYGLDAQELSFLKQVQSKENLVIALPGNAYVLKNFCGLQNAVVAYEQDSIAERVIADVLLGRRVAKGMLPVTPCTNLMTVSSLPVQATTPVAPPPIVIPTVKPADLTIGSYSEAGVTKPEALNNLNGFINKAMGQGAFPGCRVLAAKDGKIFTDLSFGRNSYDPASPQVTKETIYDVASLSKVLATNLAVMRLYEDDKIELDETLGHYLKWVRGTNKENIRIRDLLLHQAGLKSYIPFWKETMDSTGNPDSLFYRSQSEKDFEIPVAANLFIRNDYPDTMWARILTSPLETPGRYVYSDNDFYFLWAVVEKVSRKSMDAYLEDKFYKPLGLRSMGYNPFKRIPVASIPPTEDDKAFRHRLVQGYVHDQGAAMLGGVAGHAGIFSNANDVAVIFQMLLNKGTYKGKRYLKAATVDLFTAYNAANSRRGLGFDKPQAGLDASATSNRCSGFSFGHQGFTGTCAWADPATGIVFVFLSNRVNPNADNNTINRLGVRTEVQDYIYQAFGIEPDKDRQRVQRMQLGLEKK